MKMTKFSINAMVNSLKVKIKEKPEVLQNVEVYNFMCVLNADNMLTDSLFLIV